MKKIKEFYKRVRKSKFKYFLLKFSLIILFVGFSTNLINFIINDLIYKTPKPILYKGYWKVGVIGILLIGLLDFISMKFKNFKNI